MAKRWMKAAAILACTALATSTVLGMVGCSNDSGKPTQAPTQAPTTQAPTTQAPTQAPTTKPTEAPKPTETPKPTEAPVQKKETFKPTSEGYADKKEYTYRDYTSGMTNLNWNPHTWETNEDSYPMGYINMGFYDFVLGEDGKSNVVVPEMATYAPNGSLFLDVTSQYAGKFGVENGEENKAFRIFLNPNATWDDAARTPIKAKDYIYSMQQQLNPDMKNRRSDSFYGGDFSIYGAQNYLYSKDKANYSSVASLGYKSIKEALDAGRDVLINVWGFWGAQGYTDAKGNECPQWVSVKDKTVYGEAVDDAFSGAGLYEDYISYLEVGGDYSSYVAIYAENETFGYKWEDVGLIAGVDKASGLEYLDIIIENPLDTPDFYVPYYQSSTWLVKEDLYEANKIYNYTDGTKTIGKLDETKELSGISSQYCTSIETSAGYGPYTFSYLELDKEMRFTRNDSWYGYSDGKHVGQFQTDTIVCSVIEQHSTALLSFLNGEIDGISLDSSDITVYGGSSYIEYTPQSYTTKISFNTDYDKLAARQGDGINKTMATVKEFRKAFAFALDREYFASAFTAAGAPGFGLLNYMYVFDPTTGLAYRNTDAGKDALCRVFEVEYGAGKTYATLEEAYEALTGYNMDKAKAAMSDAYDYATTHDKDGKPATGANAIYNGTDKISLEFSVYSSDTVYVQMFNYLNGQIQEAAKGTKLEGKVELAMKVDSDYYNSMYSGAADMIFTTWGGATYNGLSNLSNVYCDDYQGGGNQMEVGFNTDAVSVTMSLDPDGDLEYENFTCSLKNWADWLNNKNESIIKGEKGTVLQPANKYDLELKTQVFAECEYQFLASYCTTSLYYRQVASLHSAKVNDAVDSYVDLVGFGGIRFVTYNYDDAAWAALDKATVDYTK